MSQEEVKDISWNQTMEMSGYNFNFERSKLNNLSKAKVIRACEAALKKL